MDTGIVPGGSSIGNAGATARDFARTGPISATSDHTAGDPIGAPGANAGPDFRATPGPAGAGDLELGFLTANGSHDSHAVTLADGSRNGSPRAGQPYTRITWAGIRQLVEGPTATEKDRARFVVLSTYAEQDGRTHDVQRARGVFGGLAVDIDTGNPSLEDVVAAVRAAVGDVEAEVYSSSSAKSDARKWRVLFPLSTPVSGADYRDTQEGLFALLAARGLVCDPALARPAQPVYLPNVPPKRRGPDGRPLFYAWRHLKGPRLELGPDSPIVAARSAIREQRVAEEADAARRAEEYAAKRAAYVAATGDDFDPVEDFKARHRVGELLQRYGFKPKQRGRGSHWSSPLSTSGSYSTEDRGDHWVTVSAWARNHNVGRVSRTGNSYGDAFDLYAHFEHGGDRRAAVLAYIQSARPDVYAWLEANRKRREDYLAWASGNRRGSSGGPVPMSPAVRVEPPEPVDPELVDLEQYRRDIAQAVAGAVLDNRPGLKLLRGAPGTGKTYAVARAVAKYPRGVVAVPGHELAAEVVELLRGEGADAAAYPRLDESTCENYETARRAQSAGLSAPATVCPNCPLLRQCRETGYLAGVKAAEAADHRVVTHARLARSAPRLLENAEYLVLEEDPSAVLSPMVSTTRRQLERLSDLAGVYADAMSRVWILEGAADIAPVETVSDFDAWAPEEREDDGANLFTRVNSLPPDAAGERGNTMLPRSRRSFPRGFFGQVCRVADTLATAAARALAGDIADGVHELTVDALRDIPKNPEGTVWAALETIDRVDPDAVADVSPETLQLALAVATGRARRVFLQVETDTRPGGRRSVEIVAQWRTRIPADRLPVFVNDGTLDADILERVAGDQVEDITPTGRVPLAHYAAQYPLDILPSTSTAKVAAILTGVARKHPDLERLGVILHQRHYRELLEADDSPLPIDVRSRIVWSTYFGSGADRGTNGLHRLADLCVLIGTHRPPPSEIRRTLIRWGDLEAAGMSPTWGRVDRQGVGPDGQLVPYHGRGYAETQWARAADAVIRATVRQGAARSRAIAEDGCAVVAVTTEDTGLPVVDLESLPMADDRADRVLDVVKRLAVQTAPNGDKNPRESIRENVPVGPAGGVPLEALVAELADVDYRTVKRWVARAIEAGDIVRTGNGKAVRYWLAATAPSVEPMVEPVATVAKPSTRQPPAPRPLSLARVELPADQVLEVEVSPAAPVRISESVSEKRTPPPPVVAETPPPADWLEVLLAPERHPDERIALECYLAGPHAHSIGLATAWAEETPPLVVKLHRFAAAAAKREGRPPPPVDVVARHTVAWYAQTLNAIAG